MEGAGPLGGLLTSAGGFCTDGETALAGVFSDGKAALPVPLTGEEVALGDLLAEARTMGVLVTGEAGLAWVCCLFIALG